MAAPTYRIEEITRRTGYTARAVRHYVQLGLIPGTQQRGVATVYTHEQLVRLQAISVLRKRERLRIDAVKRRLSRMALPEIEALVATLAPPDNPAKAPESALPSTFVHWDRAELLPGLEIAIRADAAPVVRRLAAEIFAKYGAAAPGEPVPPGGTAVGA